MAIVREFVTPAGVRVRINDACCAGIDAGELDRRRRDRDRAMLRANRVMQIAGAQCAAPGREATKDEREDDGCKRRRSSL